MFEPENDIERLLMRASADPSERPGCARALMDAEIFVVLVSDKPIVPGPDGKITIAPGTNLTLPNAMRGEEALIPFFTTPSRAHTWFKDDHIIAPDRTRTLFERYPDAPFLLNPGSDYGKEFTPEEVTRLLAGQFSDGPRTIVTDTPEQVLLGHPAEIPTALIEALGRELGAVRTVQGAWLMLAMLPGNFEQSWMLGVDHSGPWQVVQDAIGRAIVGDILQGKILDAVPLEGSSIASTLRTGIPVTAAKAGLQ